MNAFSIPRFQSLDLDFSEFVSVSLLQLFSLSSLFPCGTYAFMLITSLHLSSHRPHSALITFAVSHSCLIDPHSFSVAEDTRKWCPVFRSNRPRHIHMNTPKIRILKNNFRNDKIRIRICYLKPKTPAIVRIGVGRHGTSDRQTTTPRQCSQACVENCGRRCTGLWMMPNVGETPCSGFGCGRFLSPCHFFSIKACKHTFWCVMTIFQSGPT